MSVESIAAIAASQSLPINAAQASSAVAGEPSFSSLVNTGLNTMNSQLHASQIDLQKLATGDTQSLHQVMIRMEEARLSFQLFMQVRSRLLEAYQDIMKMQV